jgi:hypothetical protein
VSDKADEKSAADLDASSLTAEVGDEGGSPGDVEVGVDRAPASGREADESVRPVEKHRDVTVRDETGRGRRSP